MSLAWEGERPFVVAAKVRECVGVVSFLLAPADGGDLPPFEPGQFLTVVLDVPGQARPVVRCYSLSDAPNGDTYRISVKRVPPPRGRDVPPGLASTHLHRSIEVGHVLSVRAPAGRFFLTPGERGPLVFLGSGIGVTPLLGMLEGLVARGEERAVHFFFGVRNGREHPFRERLAELAEERPWLRLHVAYSQPLEADREGADRRHEGRVTLDLLQQHLPAADEPYAFYVCGPAPMMDDLSKGLEGLGVPSSAVHLEAFGKATVKPFTRRLNRRLAGWGGTEQQVAEVTFARSGTAVPWDPAAGNLLELGMASGVFLPFACAAGHCGTCATDLLSGEVVYPLEPQFPLREGRCLPCIAVPKGPVVIDA